MLWPDRIASKSQYIALAGRQAFGNRLREWPSIDAFLEDAFSGLVSVRYRQANAHYMRYYVPAADVEGVIAGFEEAGADRSLFWLNESAPDSALVIQGELAQLPGGLYLFGSRAKLPMRRALAEDGTSSRGLATVMMLRGALTPASFDDLMTTLDLWPGAVVEFSAFDRPVGTIPGRNAVVWEVRHY